MTDDDRAEIREFRIDFAQSDLDDLQERLARTRWTDEIEGAGWDYGTSLGYLKELTDYWRDGFDWRKQEAELNRSAQFWAEIGGFRVHFVHERGKKEIPRGRHFAAMEEPALLAEDIRAFYRGLR